MDWIFYGSFMVPSGNLLQLAIEHMAIEIVSSPIKNGGYFHSYVKLTEGRSVVHVFMVIIFQMVVMYCAMVMIY